VVEKELIERFWDERPCGDGLAVAERGTPEYFAQVEAEKARLEPYVAGFAAFDRWRGRDVLEIGCGIGTDTVRFARAGANVTGVDLTLAAVELASSWLEQEGLGGRVLQADAESLPFADESFDLVWSWGVLHHTLDAARAIREAWRVLRPGADARIMLYNRRSVFAIGVWGYRSITRRRVMSVRDALATGLESPGTKAYTRSEVEVLFAAFSSTSIETIATPYDRRLVGPLASAVPALGWNLLITAKR
jgi:SAM-dependent methyltransferase